MRIKQISEILIVSRALQSKFFESCFNFLLTVAKKTEDVTIIFFRSNRIKSNNSKPRDLFQADIFIDWLVKQLVDFNFCMLLKDVRL